MLKTDEKNRGGWSLEGFEVIERPERKVTAKTSKWKEVIDYFLELGEDCIGKRYDDKDELERDLTSIRSYVWYHRCPVSILKSDGMLIIARKKK